MVRLYLVRHCQTVGNLNGIFQGSVDTAPSEQGLVQLDLLALRFRNVPLDGIYTSPLGRAVRTAEAVNRFHGLPIQTEDGLREIGVGKMDGTEWRTIPDSYPESARQWNEEPWLFASDGGETMREVYDRISAAFVRIAGANEGRTLALVSHGCALRNLLCYCLGKPLEELNQVDFGCNTAVSLVEYEDGAVRVVYANDASHLPEETRRSHPFFHLK